MEDLGPDNVIILKRYEWYKEYLARWASRCKDIITRIPYESGVTIALGELDAEVRKVEADQYTTVRKHIAIKAIAKLKKDISKFKPMKDSKQ